MLRLLRLLPLVSLLPVTLASGQVCNLKPARSVPEPRAINHTVSHDVVATTWYPGWHGSVYPPANISWEYYSEVKYAFALTTPDPGVISLADSDVTLLPTFVSLAHSNSVNATLSVGGWTGSRYFSTGMGSAANRTAFVAAVVGLVTTYQLDGIDFDWEYPNGVGIGCNTQSSSDTANFLLFLQELRADPVGSRITVSAATGLNPWNGPSSTPSTDVSDFAKVIDYIEVMDYDVWGSWSPTVGPNAPLNDTCATTRAGSAVSALAAWTAAGFPANQITLGVASYGHSFYVPASSALASPGVLADSPPFDKSQQPSGDVWDSPAGIDECGNPTPTAGIFDFWALVEGGFLDSTGVVTGGMDYRYDDCSQTPYVYNPTTNVMISYDDATSFAAKGSFINSNGMAGFAMWHVAGDYNNILISSISGSMGIVAEKC